jgi:hypothetical protein
MACLPLEDVVRVRNPIGCLSTLARIPLSRFFAKLVGDLKPALLERLDLATIRNGVDSRMVLHTRRFFPPFADPGPCILDGGAIYGFDDPIPGSQVRFNQDYGALRVEASQDQIIF